MAQPSTELNIFRSRVTQFLDAADDIRGVLAPVDGAGADDVERKAFFTAWIDAQTDYDMTDDELIDAVVALRSFESWLDTNLATLAKMRI